MPQAPENGARTKALEDRFTAKGVEIERRVTTLETQMKIIAVVAGAILTGAISLTVLILIGVIR